jgi:hypothetical protein
MKKTLYILTMICGMLATTSCSDYLDKESDTELDLNLVFEDKTRTEGWLANVYSSIPDPYMGHLQYEGWEILGDDMTPSERYRQFDGWNVIPYILGEWTTTSGWGGNFWADFPQRIREANIFMKNVHTLASLVASVLILAHTGTLSYAVEVGKDVRIAGVALVKSLGIVEVSLAQTVEYTGSILVAALLYIVLIVHLLLGKVAVLRRVVCAVVVGLGARSKEHVVRTVFLWEVAIVESYRHIESRFAVTIHIICAAACYATTVAVGCPGCVVALLVLGRHSLLGIARVWVGNGQSVLGKEGVHKRLGNAQSAIAAAAQRGSQGLVIRVVAAARTCKQYLGVALVVALEHHVLVRHKGVDVAIRVLYGVQLVACCLGCLYKVAA